MDYVRTTVRIRSDLLKAAKRYALEHDTTFTALVEAALEERLHGSAPEPFRLPTARGGLQPGVNLESNAELLELMEAGSDVISRR